MAETPESTLRKIVPAGLESFVGAIAFHYGLILATLGWSTITKTEDPNWALIAACKIGAVSVGIAIVALYRRWATLKVRWLVRLGLIPLSLLVAWNSWWLATNVIYSSYGVTMMTDVMWFSAIPCLLAAAALLPLTYGVTACGLGGTFAGVFIGAGSRYFDDSYAQMGPFMGSLFAILCLGSVGRATLRQRLLQHAGNGLNGLCLYGVGKLLPYRFGSRDLLVGLLMIVGIGTMIGLPIFIDRLDLLRSEKRPVSR